MRVLLVDRGVIGNPHATGLAAGLRRCGLEVRIAGPAEDQEQGVTAVFPRGDRAGQRVRKGLSVPRGMSRFRSLVDGFQPDVVHFNWPTSLDGLYRRWISRRSSAAIVYTVHEPAGRGGSGRRQAAFLGEADVVLVFGAAMRDELLSRRPTLGDRVAVTRFGNYDLVACRFDRDQARAELGIPPGGGPLYVFLGTLRRTKGLETLLDAYADLKRQGEPGRLLIVGTAAEKGYLGELRARCGEAASIHWVVSRDRLEHRTLDVAASAADQIVLPFRTAWFSASVMLA